MFKIAVIIFRECLEISLLMGIIIAVTKPIKDSIKYIIMGAMTGLVLASLFAFFTRALTVTFGGLGDELFNSGIILLTTFIISWTVIWMQGYNRKIKKNITELSDRITSGTVSKFMLVFVVATVLLREGAEMLLFIYSISSAENIAVDDYITGLGIGALLGFIVGIIIYLGLIKFAGKYIFKISTILLILIAAGLASEAAGIMTSSGIIEVFSEQLWDSSWLIEDRSTIGKLLNIIIGYDSRPNVMQMIFYLGTIAFNVITLNIRTYIIKHNEI
ncbi:MAG: FTR1 family protein [Rickettsiaceae bacterium]|nr:FTR1 family protein [Rickettsiaceae bacterium]